MNLQVIKDICDSKKYALKQLACDIGMSEANLHRCIRMNKIQAEELEKISMRLDVPVSAFFESTTSEYLIGDKQEKAKEDKIEYLTKIIEEKERLIQVLLNKK